MDRPAGGPLAGVKVVELAGLGPGPFCGMVLADMGADVLRVERLPGTPTADPALPATNPLHRNKRAVACDLKHPAGVECFLRLAAAADAVIEVFRPGVAERLGIGPEECMARNPRLVYGRLTGWGQTGPLASTAGHDIDYIALAGALEPIGRAGEPPVPPINVLGDFAGGGLLLAFGIVCALLEARSSGKGQVIDAAMIDGAALLFAPFFTGRLTGGWGPRGTNFLDTGAHFYNVYETADGRYVAVGAVEPQFYAELVRRLGLEGDEDFAPAHQYDRARWPVLKERLAAVFRSRSRDEWVATFAGSDACVAPVLAPEEAPGHPHHRSRGTFVTVGGLPQPAPAPRFSRTPAAPPRPAVRPGDAGREALSAWGLDPDEIERLLATGAVA
jgi:alpha-methylacyl-CoA racemase